jgi:jumonji domain-containing protein 7
MDEIDRAICNSINTYHELNAAVVDELREVPSPLEFMRFVSKNRPFIVRRAAREWNAFSKWDGNYLRKTMGKEKVQVAVTPDGYVNVKRRLGGEYVVTVDSNADAVINMNGQLLFVEPHETVEPFADFLQ